MKFDIDSDHFYIILSFDLIGIMKVEAYVLLFVQ